MWNLVEEQFQVEMLDRGGDATLLVAGRDDDREQRQRRWGGRELVFEVRVALEGCFGVEHASIQA